MFQYRRVSNPDFWLQSRPSCNCGSFALGTPYWFSPYGHDDEEEYTEEERECMIEDLYDEGMSFSDITEVILQRDEKFILSVCPWIKPLTPEEAEEYDGDLIAYRIGLKFCEDEHFPLADDDFHFRVRMDGIWYEKNGEEEIHICENQNVNTDVWPGPSGIEYDSRILYFKRVN